MQGEQNTDGGNLGWAGIELLIECPEKTATRNLQLMYNTCLIK